MDAHARTALDGLPDPVRRMVGEVVEAAGSALGPDLVAVVLFGSGAEKRLRATSDVNLMFVLRAFERARIDPLRALLRAAEAAIRLDTMFVLESELADAAEAFASKFADIKRRHVVLAGSDPFAAMTIPRAATIYRNRQILLNLILRLRDAYALRSLREEQLVLPVAEAAAPLRAAAASLAELGGAQDVVPRVALDAFVAQAGVPEWTEALAQVVAARQAARLPPGVAAETLLRLIAIAARLRAAFDGLA